MKLSDFTGIFKTWKTEFISAENVSGDFWKVYLKPAEGMKWTSGEHAIFTIPGKKISGRKWRAFSIASSPDEGMLLIGTRTGKEASSFKKTLFSLKAGEKVKVRGPFGWYKMREDINQVVMVASGVGITPNRAILMDLKKYPSVNVELVHSGSFHLFRDELEPLAEQITGLKLHYVSGRDEMHNSLNRLATKYGNNARYYISGSLGAMSSIKKTLRRADIKGKRIVHDPFLGY